jgi:hypothetical protein
MTYRSHLQGSRSPRKIDSLFSSWTSWPLKMERTRCPDPSLKDNHSMLRNLPEEGKSAYRMLVGKPEGRKTLGIDNN